MVLTIWKVILKDEPPLSPPNLTHASFWGMTPLCHVSDFILKKTKQNVETTTHNGYFTVVIQNMTVSTY